MIDSKLLTVAEVAQRLKVSERHVYTLVQSRQLAGVKIGRCVRIPEAGLAAFLAAARIGSPAPRRGQGERR